MPTGDFWYVHALPALTQGVWSKDEDCSLSSPAMLPQGKKIKGERTTKAIPQGSVGAPGHTSCSRSAQQHRYFSCCRRNLLGYWHAAYTIGQFKCCTARFLCGGSLPPVMDLNQIRLALSRPWYWEVSYPALSRMGTTTRGRPMPTIPMATLNTTTGSLSVKR